MPTQLDQFRAKYPQYSDMSDGDLAEALHKKFYSDIPKEQYLQKLGVQPESKVEPRQESSGTIQDYIDKAKTAVQMTSPVGFAQMAGEKIGDWITEEGPQSLPSPNVGEVRLGADRVPDEYLQAQVALGRQEAYNQQPWYKKPLIAADDTARNIAHGQTFGFADKAAALANSALNGREYADQLNIERARTQAAQDRGGKASTAAELAGNVMTGTGLANKGVTLAGRVTQSGKLATAARAALLGAEGTAYGTVNALGNDTSVKEGAITGLAAGVGGSLLGDGVSLAAKKLASKAKVPNLEQLKKARDVAYDAADNAGVIIKPQPIASLKQNIKDGLADFGYAPSSGDRVISIFKEIDNLQGNNITLKGVDGIRKKAVNIAMNTTDGTERAAASIVIEKIDDMLDGVKPTDILTGDKIKGLKALKDGRELHKRYAKNEKLTWAIYQAENRAGATHSGGNVQNAARQNVRKLLEKNKGRGWTPDEKAAMQEIVRGSFGQNALRLIGKLSPQGSGIMTGGAILGTMSNPVLGAVPLAGIAAKVTSDRSVMTAINQLDELIRAGGSKQALDALQGTVAQLSGPQREALARIMIMAGISSESGRN